MNYSISTKKTWGETMAELRETFEKWSYDIPGAGRIDWGVECPVSAARAHNRSLPQDDRRVTLAFVHPKTGREVSLSVAHQQRPVDNLRVCYLAVEAIRMNEKRGLGDTIQEAYLQLAAPTRQRDPFEVLGVRSDAPAEVIEGAYRSLAKRYHPDVGGDPDKFKEVTEAWDAIQRHG